MKKLVDVLFSVVLLAVVTAGTVQAREPAKESRPNVIIIFVDDLGWTDLGCCGSRFYETPNIDKLAGQGAMFTRAYSPCNVCSPTRASLLSHSASPRQSRGFP
jgi:hypothetical protein